VAKHRDPYLAGWNDAVAAAVREAESYDGRFKAPSNIACSEVTAREITQALRSLKRPEDE
jgi:hypothetical protein